MIDPSFPPMGTPMDVNDHPSDTGHTATQRYAGDIMDTSDMFKNMQQSNSISRSLDRGSQESKPKADVVPLRPFNKPNFYQDSIKK